MSNNSVSKDTFCFSRGTVGHARYRGHSLRAVLRHPILPWQRAEEVIQSLFIAFKPFMSACLGILSVVKKVESPWSKNQSADCASLLVWSPLWSLFPSQVTYEWPAHSWSSMFACWSLIPFCEQQDSSSESFRLLSSSWMVGSVCVVKWMGFNRWGWFVQGEERKHLDFSFFFFFDMRLTVAFLFWRTLSCDGFFILLFLLDSLLQKQILQAYQIVPPFHPFLLFFVFFYDATKMNQY